MDFIPKIFSRLRKRQRNYRLKFNELLANKDKMNYLYFDLNINQILNNNKLKHGINFNIIRN